MPPTDSFQEFSLRAVRLERNERSLPAEAPQAQTPWAVTFCHSRAGSTL